MLQMLITFVMNIIITIIQAIFTPFLTALFALFPSLSTYFTYITNFLTTGLQYVGTCLNWLCFDTSMFTLLFDYFLLKYSIHLLIQAIKFAINMYNKLKP